MTKIEYVSTPTMASPGGYYSHAVKANGMLFISGQLPISPSGEKLANHSFEEQAVQVLENVRLALVAGGASIANLVQVRVYVTDIENWPAFNKLYSDWAGDSKPARAVVPVPILHYGFLIEIEAVAVVD